MAEGLSSTDQLLEQIITQKQKLGQYGQLIEISLTLSSTLDPETLLNSIISTGMDILDCEAVSILLYDDENNRLRFAASTNLTPEEAARIPVPLDSSIAGAIFTSNRPELINDAYADHRIYKPVGDTVELTTRNLIGVPMNIGEKTIGVLEGINKIQQVNDGKFSKEDVDILAVIASQAAVAINNARLLQSVQIAYEELATMDKLKSDFMANASHELRTPLNIILGYSEFLREDAEGATADYANMVLNAAMQLRTLIEDMTNMNLLESGDQEMNIESVVIQQVVHEAYKDILKEADAKGHNLERDYDRNPLNAMLDREKFKRVIVNILHNAVRFSPNPSQILITVKSDGENAIITIRDQGIGIPKSELEKIFDEFYQVEDHRTRTYGGLGLGLAIARGIVRLHNGRIWAESEGENKGTTLKVSIPLHF